MEFTQSSISLVDCESTDTENEFIQPIEKLFSRPRSLSLSHIDTSMRRLGLFESSEHQDYNTDSNGENSNDTNSDTLEEEVALKVEKTKSTPTMRFTDEYLKDVFGEGPLTKTCNSCSTIHSLPNQGDLDGTSGLMVCNKKFTMMDPSPDMIALQMETHRIQNMLTNRCLTDFGELKIGKIRAARTKVDLKQSYINDYNLDKYFEIMEKWVKATPGTVEARELVLQLSELLDPLRLGTVADVSFQMDVFERINGELEVFIKEVFIVVVGHYFFLPQNTFRDLSIELDREKIQEIATSLYPGFPELFEFIRVFEAMKLFIAKNLLQDLVIEGDPNEDFERLVLAKMPYFFDFTFVHEHPEVMRVLYDLCLNTLRCFNQSNAEMEFKYNSEHFEKLVDRSVLIFLMHCTFDSELSTQLCSVIQSHKVRYLDCMRSDNPTRMEPTSYRMVQLLYQVALLLAGVATAYDGGEKYLQSLLTFDMRRKCSKFFSFTLNITNYI